MYRKPFLLLSGTLAILVAGAIIFISGSSDAVGEPATTTITLKPDTEYQIMRGWEATADVAEGKQRQVFDLAKDAMLDSIVDEIGINRVRLEIKSGAENTQRAWERYSSGELDAKGWHALRYATVNDNSDPNVIDWAGFDFSKLDNAVEDDVLPMRERLAARGEKLFINLCYVAFTQQITDGEYIHDDPEEYAELVLATFLHLRDKYGFVPDTWEVILEPDLVAEWTPHRIGKAIVATARRLKENGFTPRFVIPSVTDTGNAPRFIKGIASVKGAMQYVAEFSYHRYKHATLKNVEEIAWSAERYAKPTSMLEFWFGRGNSKVLFEDLTAGNVSSFQGRTLFGQFDMSISTDGKPHFSIRKEVVENSQLYRYIRVGAVRIGVDSSRRSNVLPVAFRNPNGAIVVALLVNKPSLLIMNNLPAGHYQVSYASNGKRVVEPNPIIVTASGEAKYDMAQPGVVTFAELSDAGEATGL